MKRSIVWLLTISLLFSMCACSLEQPDSFLDDALDDFAYGKPQEDYSLPNSGTLLDSLIDDYSGSYYMPDTHPMSDDDYAAISKDDDDKEDAGDSGNTAGGQIINGWYQVGDWSDFLNAFHYTYESTAESIQFKLVNGYTLTIPDAFQDAYTELQREDPIHASGVASWSYWISGNEYVVSIKYSYDIDEFIEMKEQTPELVTAAADSIDTEGMNAYEIVCAVNDYLCDTVYYPEEPYAPVTHTAYGALNNGVAVCEGYACAAKLLLNELGIMCDIQVGTCHGGGGHAWNLVKLEGDWYQMDVTWNDGSSSRSDYLLVTDNYMKKSRFWDESKYPKTPDKPYTP